MTGTRSRASIAGPRESPFGSSTGSPPRCAASAGPSSSPRSPVRFHLRCTRTCSSPPESSFPGVTSPSHSNFSAG